MKKKKVLSMLALTGILVASTSLNAFACTGVYVGKDVSTDGTTLVSRSEDIGSGYTKRFVVHKGETHKKGSMFKDAYGFSMPYPTKTFTYSAVEDSTKYGEGKRPYGEVGFNEYGVGVTATVSASPNESAKKADPLVKTGICEISLTEVILMQAKTAKEGVQAVANIMDKYGSGEGNIIMIGDAKETWYMEMLTGHQYAAIKMPNDKAAVFPNTFMLGTIDVNSKDVIVSKDLVNLPKENGFLVTKNNMIHVSKTYGVGLTDGNLYRAWGGLNKLKGAVQEFSTDMEIDLFQTPSKKISINDVKNILSYRYEDTKFNVNLPENSNIRPIGTPNQAECHIMSFDNTAKNKVAGVQWLAMGNSEFSIYLPSYTALMTTTHKAYQKDTINYDKDSAYWAFRSVATLCALDREQYGASVKEYYDKYQKALIEAQAKIAPQMEKLYNKDPKAAAKKANELSKALTEDTLKNINSIHSELVKYIAASEGKEQKAPFVPTVAKNNIMPNYTFK
ncbi:MAG: C69 family dipeptidase [Anaerovoracaceae bacterium]